MDPVDIIHNAIVEALRIAQRMAALRYMLELGPFGPRAEPPKKATPKTANEPQKIPLSVRNKQLRNILANRKRGK